MDGPTFLMLADETNAVAICRRMIGCDFPWEINRALELAVLRTFCVPRISQLLHTTGEFVHRPQKRYDDTSLILGNIMKWGYDSPRGRAAIAQMNRIHKRYAINNQDFLYVLSVLIYEPVRWNQRFGWRPFTPVEKQALFDFWRVVGQRMAIADIPTTYDAFEQFNQAYETEHFCYHPSNQVVGNAVVTLMQSWFPAMMTPLIPWGVRMVIDEPMRRALGWSQPPQMLAQVIRWSLRKSRQALRWLPRRRQSAFKVDEPNQTYPVGYEIDQLGPADTTAKRPATRCPFAQMQSLLGSRHQSS
ncbi:MAG: oxygenase MpaB family protein [Cyanobacteria bacterium P01_H01_bin.58]